MTSDEFAILVKECEAMLRARAPYKTGNLRYNAIKLKMIDANTAKLYVDEKIAPYMVYTNEPWDAKFVRSGNFRKGESVVRLRTWHNPNEGWFDKAAKEIAEYVAIRLQGDLRQ